MRNDGRYPQDSRSGGFSLVELLVVVSIIGLLIGLSSVAIPKAMEAGRRAKAKGDLTAIVAAVKAYQQEYGILPIDPADVGSSGWDRGSFGGSGNSESYKSWIKILCGDSTVTIGQKVMNPKGVIFLENLKKNDRGLVVDPWDNPYFIKMDCDESGGVNYYYVPDTVENIRLQVIAVSMGKNQTLDDPDKKMTATCDDVFSWQ